MQSGGVHHQSATQVHRLGSADLELDAALYDPALLHGAVKRKHRAPAFGVAL